MYSGANDLGFAFMMDEEGKLLLININRPTNMVFEKHNCIKFE